MLNNYKLDKIKNAKTLSEQKNRTKDLLTTTDFIFQKDVLTFFDDEKSSKEENYLKKFMEYRYIHGLNSIELSTALNF